MIEALAATYLAVLAAEVVGDKFLYTTGLLATRYRATPMIVGIALGFMVKMGVAVLLGDMLTTLPPVLIAGVMAAGILWVAVQFWHAGNIERVRGEPRNGFEALKVSCVSVLVSEWCDFGQLTAAAMAARFDFPVFVWLGAVAAMMTKGLVVAALGATIRTRFQQALLRPRVVYLTVCLLLIIGVFSVAESLFARH